MKNSTDNVSETLQHLLATSEELSTLLRDGDPESIIEKLRERESLLTQLNDQVTQGAKLEDEKSIVPLILDLDKRNAELLATRMNKTYESMTELINQKRIVGNLKSFSKSKPKQVVDLLL